MRSAQVLYKGEVAGILTQKDDSSFHFKYSDNWIVNETRLSISLTLPKREKEFSSKALFPFFYHLLPEGTNKRIVAHLKNFSLIETF